MSTFQIIVLGIFASLILIGIGVFAAFGGVLGNKSNGPVLIWGTLEQQTMDDILGALYHADKSFDEVTYVQKSPETYNADLINAMASGSGPDLFMLDDENFYSFKDKLLLIPYSITPQGSFLASYVDEGTLFLTREGIEGLPFILDPLVMYWNRDLFASAGIATPPKYWNELLIAAPKITALDASSNLKKSAAALGEWRNIPAAKGMLATLFMQAGDSIIGENQAGQTAVTLGQAPEGSTRNPAESALQFYTEFANPSKTSYSWNRSLQDAPAVFAAGDLGAYFGYASEYASIRERNPNLRFSVAVLPQIEGNSSRVVYAKITALAISRTAKNVNGALAIAQKLTDKQAVAYVAGALSLPPVRRDVTVDASGNAAAGVFAESALISRAWLDPNKGGSSSIFQDMIESVVSGKSTPATAITDARRAFEQLLPQ
jgi:multiple sugar transport system substrate-binding protein